MDDALGQIFGAIEQYEFADNTLILFIDDNGGLQPRCTKPYRGTKNTRLRQRCSGAIPDRWF